MSLPRGITYRYVATLFVAGLSIGWLMIAFRSTNYDIQHAIRTVLRRQKAYR